MPTEIMHEMGNIEAGLQYGAMALLTLVIVQWLWLIRLSATKLFPEFIKLFRDQNVAIKDLSENIKKLAESNKSQLQDISRKLDSK